MPLSHTPLCVADDRTFWPWLTWTDFAGLRAEAGETTVILPLAGMADWGLGHAYDAEELVLTAVLRDALRTMPPSSRMLMLPPLRFVIGPDANCVCAVEPPLAHTFIEEIVSSVAAAGFTRIVLVNASPWNEELVDAAARDLRVDRGLQMFCVNFAALGLDFHPARGSDRRRLQTLLTFLARRAPDNENTAGTTPRLFATLAEAELEGPATLAQAARHLATLLAEIAAHPPLRNHGALDARTCP